MTTRSDHTPEAAPSPPAARGPLDTPMSRRRALLVIGAGTIAAGAGLGTILAGCGPSLPAYPVWVTLGLDPAELPVGEPARVPLTATWDGGSLDISTWLVRDADGAVTAFSPMCTHANCEYTWVADAAQFACPCHEAAFALDGTVLNGPPPRPLDRWAMREAGGAVEVEVTGRVRPSPAAATPSQAAAGTAPGTLPSG